MDSTLFVMILIGSIIGYILLAVFTRWLLGLDGMYERQIKEIKVLREIALKQGVSEEKLNDILVNK